MDSSTELDDGKWYVWYLAGAYGPPIPPYQMEIVMKNGSSYYVHSGNGRDEDTQSVCMNVWDIRALDVEATAEILKIISEPGGWNEFSSKQPYEIHHLLSIGRLRCGLDEISHSIEWWSRAWIFDNNASDVQANKPLGFTAPERERKKTSL